MSTLTSHIIIPVEVPSLGDNLDHREQLAAMLHQAMQSIGHPYEHNNKHFALSTHPSYAAAYEAAEKPARGILGADTDGFVHETINQDTAVWVTVSCLDGAPLATIQLVHEALDEQILQSLLEQYDSPAFAATREALNALSSGSDVLRQVLLDVITYDLKSDIADELPRTPYEESVEVGNRHRYVGEAFKVDPVSEMFTNPYALRDAAAENSIDYIGQTEHEAIQGAMEKCWSEDAQEDLMPLIEMLGFSEGDVTARLEDFTRDALTERGGAIKIKPTGAVAIAARPKLGKEGIYITFDGITSSRLNAVVDEDYLAMLDLLKIDPKAWVDHLAEAAGLGKANWDIDVKAIIHDHLRDARFDPATGYHWEGEALHESLRSTLIQALFSPTTDAIDADKVKAAEDARIAYRAAMKADAPDEQLQTLKDAMTAAQEACFDDAGESTIETAEYLFDIALEVVKAKAEDLDAQWLQEHGVNLDRLGQISSSTEQLATFPQMAQMPHYYMAVANLNSGNSLSYEWSAPPHQPAADAPLMSMDNLVSVLDNANYSGNLVIAFDCDLDDLLKIGLAASSEKPQEVTISGAYMHIHDYLNGAGDGEPLARPITIPVNDLASSKWDLRNDLTNSYGISGVFGEFLAEDCGIMLHEIKPAVTRELEAEAPSI